MRFGGKLTAVAAVLLWTIQGLAQDPGGMMMGPPPGGMMMGPPPGGMMGPPPGGMMMGPPSRGGDRDGSRGRGGPPFGGDPGGPPFGGDRGPGEGFRGGGPPFGGDGGPGRPPSGGYRGRGGRGGEERIARMEGMLRGLDANGNGIIEPDEVPEERKRILGFMAQRAGIEINGPISIDKFRDAMLGRDTSGGKESSKKPEPLVAGFGTDKELARVPGFGERVEASAGRSSYGSSRSSSSRGSSGRTSSSGSEPDEERIRGFAKSMIRRNDGDGSGVLERHEWGQLRGDPNEIDLDHNGKITEDEMTKRLVNYSQGRGRGGGERSDSSQGGRSERPRPSGSNDAGGPVSYRFRTAMEMLPEGLPPWFAELDRGGDGQVSMAEYSSYWDDRKANEFARLDLNNDGLITPRECLDAGASPEPAAAATGPPPGAPSPTGVPGGAPSPSKGPAAPQPKPAEAAEKPWWET